MFLGLGHIKEPLAEVVDGVGRLGLVKHGHTLGDHAAKVFALEVVSVGIVFAHSCFEN